MGEWFADYQSSQPEADAPEADIECQSEPEMEEPELNDSDSEQVNSKEPEIKTESTPVRAGTGRYGLRQHVTPPERLMWVVIPTLDELAWKRGGGGDVRKLINILELWTEH